jgi:cbb3-type cytochrome oxidase maturation protein
MTVIVLLILAGGTVAGGFLAAFAWAVRSGQFDDTVTPAFRILHDDTEPRRSVPGPPAHSSSKGESCPLP